MKDSNAILNISRFETFTESMRLLLLYYWVQQCTNLCICQPHRKPYNKNKISLHNPDIGKMFSVLCDLLLSLLIFVPLFSLQTSHFLLRQWLKVCWVLRICLTTSWAQTIFIRTDSVPAETTYL
jgi:hypothetical protein